MVVSVNAPASFTGPLPPPAMMINVHKTPITLHASALNGHAAHHPCAACLKGFAATNLRKRDGGERKRVGLLGGPAAAAADDDGVRVLQPRRAERVEGGGVALHPAEGHAREDAVALREALRSREAYRSGVPQGPLNSDNALTNPCRGQDR